tara:strand:+ start:316 stop:660 length:345 start_codon:yes stop_codon:yes gene_type:complete
MANNERLTKRVKRIEQWMAENEEMGGPKGYLDTMVFLINQAKMSQEMQRQAAGNFNRLKGLSDEFLIEQDLGEEWNKFLEEKDAVQKQQTEEVSVQEQAESGEETSEAPEEKKK